MRRTSRDMRLRRPMRFESLEDRIVLAVSFSFDYSLDTNGFFSDSARRTALSRAALMITSHLNDTLSAITPSGTNTWNATIPHPATGSSRTFTNPTVAADTIVIYAGGRDLPAGTLGIGGSSSFSSRGTRTWLNTVKGRGEPGALLSSPTDVAPKIGYITFDTSGVNWHFGLTTSGLASNEVDFMSVAMHELGHVLGINNSATNSWGRLIKNGFFTGAKTRAANGGRNVPVASGNAHFAEGTMSPRGTEVAMDPTLTTGTRKFFGAIDFAALDDIGWELRTSDDSIFRAIDKIAKPQRNSGPIGSGDGVGFVGSIGSSLDVDIYRIFADATVRLTVSVFAKSGGRSVDTYVRLFDGAGTSLATADQGGTGGTDSLAYTIPRKDYYYVAISSYANRAYDPLVINSGPGGPLGDYQISIGLDL